MFKLFSPRRSLVHVSHMTSWPQPFVEAFQRKEKFIQLLYMYIYHLKRSSMDRCLSFKPQPIWPHCHAFLSTYVANRVETFYYVFVGNANCMDAVFTSSTVIKGLFFCWRFGHSTGYTSPQFVLLSFSGVRQHNAHCVSSYLPPQTLHYPIVFCY